MKIALALLLTAALALSACGGKDKKSSSADKKTKAGCEKVAKPKPRKVKKTSVPDLKLDPSKEYVVEVKTSCGDFEITLDAKQSPKTGGSFLSLVKQGFYDGLGFHRIVAGFVVQGGDPKGNGSGGPGYSVEEKPPADLTYTAGVVAMAKTGTDPAGTSGSQFFVVTSTDAGLPPEYALLGEVSKGMDTVYKIEGVETKAGDAPVEPVVIEKISLTQ